MVVGLGTGSTAKYAVLEIGRKLREGELSDVRGIPTSEATQKLALEQGIALIELDEAGVDIAIDGADEIDPQLNLIKGLGGALLREKIVEANANRFIVIADQTKLVQRLGRGRLPVEIVPFGYKSTLRELDDALYTFSLTPWGEGRTHRLELRMEGDQPFLSDSGNYIVHITWSSAPETLADMNKHLNQLPGVVDTGLFFEYATLAIIAGHEGITTLEGNYDVDLEA